MSPADAVFGSVAAVVVATVVGAVVAGAAVGGVVVGTVGAAVVAVMGSVVDAGAVSELVPESQATRLAAAMSATMTGVRGIRRPYSDVRASSRVARVLQFFAALGGLLFVVLYPTRVEAHVTGILIATLGWLFLIVTSCLLLGLSFRSARPAPAPPPQ